MTRKIKINHEWNKNHCLLCDKPMNSVKIYEPTDHDKNLIEVTHKLFHPECSCLLRRLHKAQDEVLNMEWLIFVAKNSET